MTYNEYLDLIGGGNGTGSVTIKNNVPVAEWGNKTLQEIGVDSTKPVQEVFYNDNSAGMGVMSTFI